MGIVLVFMVVGFSAGAWNKDPTFIFGPLLMLAVGGFVFYKLLWNIADEVRDGGSFLIVRKGGIEERVPLSSVMNVNMSMFSNPRRLTLRLRTPGKFGDEVTFIPKGTMFQFNPLARNAIAESLTKRVDAARRES
jgi:hypothetical protein